MRRMMKQLFSLTLAIAFLVCLMPVSASAAEVTTILSNESVDAGWQQKDINTTNWGGSLDVNVLTEGGYFTVRFTGENVWNVHLCLNAPWTQLTHEANTFTVCDDGSYMTTFSYEECVSAYGAADLSGVGSVSLIINSQDGASNVSLTYTAAEDAEEPTEDPTDNTTEPAEDPEESKPTSSGTILFSGSQSVDAAWTLGLNIDTTKNGGSFDPAEMADGGYFTVTYTGTKGALYMAIQDAVNWGWFQIDAPASTTENADGSYTSTFAYADLTASYGGAADFSDLGKVFVGTGNSTGTTVITELAWHAEAKTEDPEETVDPSLHNTKLNFNDASWWPGTGDNPVTGYVSGAGTYTMTWKLGDDFYGDPAEGVVTFYIDVVGGASLLRNCELTALTITADGVDIPVDLSKVKTGDLEWNGNYRIEIYNEWGNTKNNPPIDVSALNFSEELTVSFTLYAPPSDGTNADTGDSFNPALILVMLASAAALGLVLSKRREYLA